MPALCSGLTTKVVECLGLHHPLLACYLLQGTFRPALPLSPGPWLSARGWWCPAAAERLSAPRGLRARASAAGVGGPEVDCGPACPVWAEKQGPAGEPDMNSVAFPKPPPGMEVEEGLRGALRSCATTCTSGPLGLLSSWADPAALCVPSHQLLRAGQRRLPAQLCPAHGDPAPLPVPARVPAAGGRPALRP